MKYKIVNLQNILKYNLNGLYYLQAAPPKKISLQEAHDKKYFGPVYHGTDQDRLENIEQEGFKFEIGPASSGLTKHGYDIVDYGNTGSPPPVHHLGYGVYFTTVKAIAKTFSGGTTKGMKTYYLNVPKIEIINFGSPRTMMKWWVENGFDPQLAKKDVVKATKKLTNQLKNKYHAVWFKGKGLQRLLDGDQIVVFDPKRIYEIDKKLSKGTEIGAKVKRNNDGMVGVITDKRKFGDFQGLSFKQYFQKQIDFLKNVIKEHPDKDHSYRLELISNLREMIAKGYKDPYYYTIKWKKGGTGHNHYRSEFEPLS